MSEPRSCQAHATHDGTRFAPESAAVCRAHSRPILNVKESGRSRYGDRDRYHIGSTGEARANAVAWSQGGTGEGRCVADSNPGVSPRANTNATPSGVQLPQIRAASS